MLYCKPNFILKGLRNPIVSLYLYNNSRTGYQDRLQMISQHHHQKEFSPGKIHLTELNAVPPPPHLSPIEKNGGVRPAHLCADIILASLFIIPLVQKSFHIQGHFIILRSNHRWSRQNDPKSYKTPCPILPESASMAHRLSMPLSQHHQAFYIRTCVQALPPRASRSS